MNTSISEQFKRPKGLFGWIAGTIMSIENRKLNQWTIQQTRVKRGDHLLEIGFGPGYAVNWVLKHFSKTTLVGVDVSKTMLELAEHKNRDLIKKRRVLLKVDDIATFDTNRRFNKIFSVNNYTLWKKPKQSIENIYDILEYKGIVSISFQPREKGASVKRTKEVGKEIAQNFRLSGFKNVKISYKKIFPILSVCVSAVKK
jgi:cyclopropane fatty-acyl-phospholipid synthase-like methyltransferase